MELSLPLFKQIAGTELDLALIGYDKIIGSLVLLSLLVGLVAGSYPALFLSSYKPVDCLSAASNAPVRGASVFLRDGMMPLLTVCASGTIPLADTSIITCGLRPVKPRVISVGYDAITPSYKQSGVGTLLAGAGPLTHPFSRE